jgi:purine catabolism regulator
MENGGMSMPDNKKEKLMKRVEDHLRKTSRQLIKIDTEEEALQYLTDSFRSELYCDFVGVVLNENGIFIPKAWSGDLPSVADFFPLSADDCSQTLLHQSLTYETAEPPEKCRLSEILKKSNVKTWFTVPLKDDTHHFGFCIVGFFNYVPLLDMEESFEEFGKDIAVVMTMTRQKEAQLKKMKGFEWISKNLSLDAPLEQHIAELTSRAGIGTNADFACIYLYNEKENCFVFQPPSYGKMERAHKIMIQDKNLLKYYFPFLEVTGSNQLTIPLVIDLKVIGVLHIENKREGVFTEEDLGMLELLSKHVATILENARLYNNEKDHKQRLQYLMDYQQALVKETVEEDSFDGITSMLSDLFQHSVILFDQFMQPISFSIPEPDKNCELEQIAELAREEKKNNNEDDMFMVRHPNHDENFFSFWVVNGGGRLLGYLAVGRTREEIDEFDRLTVDLARNICSIQFIKQKLVLDAKEQARDGFISKLLTGKIEDKESILQYANLFQWNPFQRHQLAVLSISLDEKEMEDSSLLEQQAKKAHIWEFIKKNLSDLNKGILTASYDDVYILIIQVEKEQGRSKKFWATLYESIKQWATDEFPGCRVLMGIGSLTEKIEDYYKSYQQALQALKVVNSRFRDIGFSLFEDLGSYVILHHLDYTIAVDLFIKNQLGPLLEYSKYRNIDLCNTLHVFLQNNGNVKSTAKELYMHRSSLLYRLEKIETLLEVDLNDAEVRFNLMMALKLYDMYGENMKKTTNE